MTSSLHMKMKDSLDPNPFNTPNEASATAGTQLSPWQPKQIVNINLAVTKDKGTSKINL